MPNTPARCRICKQHPAECKCEYDEKGLCAVCGEPKQAHYGPDASVREACYRKMAKQVEDDRQERR